jgi:hypothetical protein
LEKGEIQENTVRNNLFLHYSWVPSDQSIHLASSQRKPLTVWPQIEFRTTRNKKRISRITRHSLRSISTESRKVWIGW